jgi:toxin-antitoxin system PIN domain toxin
MKTCLLDVNVLLALSWPHHLHHNITHQWWIKASVKRWASCLQTQLGFIRISCHPQFCPTPATPAHAMGVLRELTGRSDHELWMEMPDGTRNPDLAQRVTACLSHGQVSDAYLAALAAVRGGHLATLDRSLVARHPDVAILVG